MEWSATAGGGGNIKPCPNGARGMLYVQPVSLPRRKSIRVLTPPYNLHLTSRIKFRPLAIEPPVAQWLASPNKTSEGRLREVENAPFLHP